MKLRQFLALGIFLAGARAGAEDYWREFSFGLQAGAAVPTGDDLRVTTGSAANLCAGIHATWHIDEFHSLRPRLELWAFGRGEQEVALPQAQRIETRVQGIALGTEYLFHPATRRERWSVGAGLYLIRWSVKSTNELSFPDSGTVRASGTSSWLRPGAGLVGCFRLTSHLQVEARWLSSRYGYEDLPARLGTVSLLLNF